MDERYKAPHIDGWYHASNTNQSGLDETIKWVMNRFNIEREDIRFEPFIPDGPIPDDERAVHYVAYAVYARDEHKYAIERLKKALNDYLSEVEEIELNIGHEIPSKS